MLLASACRLLDAVAADSGPGFCASVRVNGRYVPVWSKSIASLDRESILGTGGYGKGPAPLGACGGANIDVGSGDQSAENSRLAIRKRHERPV